MKLNEIQHNQILNNHDNNIDKNDLVLERDSLMQENQLFKNAIDEWSKRFEDIRLENEQITKSVHNFVFFFFLQMIHFIWFFRQLTEKDQRILEFEENNAQVCKLNIRFFSFFF